MLIPRWRPSHAGSSPGAIERPTMSLTNLLDRKNGPISIPSIPTARWTLLMIRRWQSLTFDVFSSGCFYRCGVGSPGNRLHHPANTINDM